MALTLQQVIFIALAIVVIGAALFVVTTRNLFRAALMLVLSFFAVAGFYVLLDAGLFAVAQILIYIGAISILIIFSVMLTRGMQAMIPRNSQAVASAVVVAIIFAALLLLLGPFRTTVNAAAWPIIGSIFPNATPRELGAIPWAYAVEPATGLPAVVPDTYIATFGISLVDINQYVLPFLLVALLVDIALSGAVHIARQRRPIEVIQERQDIAAEDREEAEAIRTAQQPPPVPAPALPEGAVAAATGAANEH
jgi:NADH-quinone oxidoreductase subunit J